MDKGLILTSAMRQCVQVDLGRGEEEEVSLLFVMQDGRLRVLRAEIPGLETDLLGPALLA